MPAIKGERNEVERPMIRIKRPHTIEPTSQPPKTNNQKSMGWASIKAPTAFVSFRSNVLGKGWSELLMDSATINKSTAAIIPESTAPIRRIIRVCFISNLTFFIFKYNFQI